MIDPISWLSELLSFNATHSHPNEAIEVEKKNFVPKLNVMQTKSQIVDQREFMMMPLSICETAQLKIKQMK